MVVLECNGVMWPSDRLQDKSVISGKVVSHGDVICLQEKLQLGLSQQWALSYNMHTHTT